MTKRCCSFSSIVSTQRQLQDYTAHHKHLTQGTHPALYWLPICYRIQFKILLITFKSLHGMAPLYISQLLTPYTAPGSLRERINYCYRFHSSGLKPCFHCFSSALLKRLPPTIRSAHLKEKNPLYIRDIPSLWHHIDTRVKTKRVKQFKPKLLMIVVTCGDYWAHSWNFGCIEYTLLKHDKSKTHSSASAVSPFSFT